MHKEAQFNAGIFALNEHDYLLDGSNDAKVKHIQRSNKGHVR